MSQDNEQSSEGFEEKDEQQGGVEGEAIEGLDDEDDDEDEDEEEGGDSSTDEDDDVPSGKPLEGDN